ncbi:hypothetical protein Tco_0575098, partial [Tanacetum coccineum]
VVQPPAYQAPAYQAPAPQTQGVSKTDFDSYVKANDAVMRNMQNQNQVLQNQGNFIKMNTASTSGTGSLPSNTVANPKGELKYITTQSGLVLDEPSVHIPHPFINPEEDEREEEILTDQDNSEFTIKLHINITLFDALILIPKYQKMLKSLLSNKEKLIELANTPVSENCSAVILKKLPEKLGDPGRFYNTLCFKVIDDVDKSAMYLLYCTHLL